LTVAGYLGSDWGTARFAEARARDAGLSALRAQVVGNISSFRDGWVFRKRLAERVKCSVRTVQRAITQARDEGLLGVARAKEKSEVPPGADGPIPCGWSHRWTIGRELAGEQLREAIARAKLARLIRKGFGTSGVPHAPKPSADPPRRYSTAELDAALVDYDAELQRLADAALAADDARARAGPGRHN
jgi:hypothetical protein